MLRPYNIRPINFPPNSLSLAQFGQIISKTAMFSLKTLRPNNIFPKDVKA